MSDQIRTLTLKCPSCGAALEVSPDMERFSCGYCGTEQIVQRRGGTVSLKLIADSISRVQAGTDRTAAELALARLKHELAAIDSNLIEINKKIAQPLGSLPPPPKHHTNTYAAFYIALSFVGFVVGLWFYAAESYKTLATLIVVWLAFGIPVFAEVSRAFGVSGAHFKSHVAALHSERELINSERERVLADIAANKSVVRQSK